MRYDMLINFDYEGNKKQIFDIVVSHIQEAHESKLPKIFIRELTIIDEKVDVIAQEKDWPDCLTKALNFYKQIEDYESCSKCQTLLAKIQSPNKKTKSNGRKTS
jgi:hypothetical protein